MLASGFCLSGGRLLADDCIDGGLVSARRSSSGGGECFEEGGGESRVGGGERRVGSGAWLGLLRGGFSTLLIDGVRGDGFALEIGLDSGALDSADELELGELATGELELGELAGAVGRVRRASISSWSSVSVAPSARAGAGSRRESLAGGRVESGMRGPPSSAFRRWIWCSASSRSLLMRTTAL